MRNRKEVAKPGVTEDFLEVLPGDQGKGYPETVHSLSFEVKPMRKSWARLFNETLEAQMDVSVAHKQF